MNMLIHGSAVEKNQAFTIVEALVSSVIFLLVASGLFATISALSKPTGTSTRELTAALVAKGLLENLRMNVDAESWNVAGGAFTVGSHGLNPVTINGVSYTPYYTVTSDPSGSQGRMVTLSVNWTE